MHIVLNSSRKTAIGTLRTGVVYNLNERHPKVRQAVDPLIQSKVAKKLTGKDLKAALEGQVEDINLDPPPEEIDFKDPKAARRAVKALTKDRDLALDRAEKAEALVSKLTAELDEKNRDAAAALKALQDELKAALDRVDELEAEVAKAETDTSGSALPLDPPEGVLPLERSPDGALGVGDAGTDNAADSGTENKD